MQNELENNRAKIVQETEKRTRTESEQTINDLRNRLSAKGKDCDELRAELSKSKEENGRLNNVVSALKEENSKYKDSVQELENTKEEYKKQQQYIQKLNGMISERDARVNELNAKVGVKDQEIKTLQGMVYPSEFADDADYAILKEHLYGWLKTKTAGAELAASALEMFAQRVAINAVLENDVSWELALRNVALGVSQAVYANDKSAGAVINELVLWSKFLMKFSDENFDFYLEIPNVGDNFDISRMSAKKSNISKVSRVITWGVRHNQFGIWYNAEVE